MSLRDHQLHSEITLPAIKRMSKGDYRNGASSANVFKKLVASVYKGTEKREKTLMKHLNMERPLHQFIQCDITKNIVDYKLFHRKASVLILPKLETDLVRSRYEPQQISSSVSRMTQQSKTINTSSSMEMIPIQPKMAYKHPQRRISFYYTQNQIKEEFKPHRIIQMDFARLTV